MNEDLNRLQHDLEQATAVDAPDAPLEPRTAALRESWLLLGQLIEAAQPVPDEPLKLKRFPVEPRRGTHTGSPRTVVAVLAASMLVTVTLAWSLTQNASQDIVTKPTDSQPPLDVQWDDSLDEQIALAGEQLTRVQQDWHSLDDALASVAYAVEEFGEELTDDTL
ncbi:MAG: hypothetical protein GY953_15665 [bacterium]|nr:hypothetical protein [bacterium]